MDETKRRLMALPSVDEVLKSPEGQGWLGRYPRGYVTTAIRKIIDQRRRAIRSGGLKAEKVLIKDLAPEIEEVASRLSAFSLTPVINATGVVIHTNLGRSPLTTGARMNVLRTASGYSNLEYDLDEGRRGSRHTHAGRLLREVTGAEDAIAVNNNAAAVLLTLNALASGREVIVSRGELVEIGGSFRIPDVMAAGGAILREVGATNKTHLFDYENAIGEETALILKVHRSNYTITGFTEEVPVEELAALGKKRGVPVVFDLGSGCLVDLRPFGIHSEPTVRDIISKGVDLVTFSGDKLLGGPQAGIIAGKKELVDKIKKNPIARAVRADKMTLAALEATLMEYVDPEQALTSIPTLNMLLMDPENIKQRAKKAARILKKALPNAEVGVLEDYSKAGGGALPELELPTYTVSITMKAFSASRLEEKLRKFDTPVIARVKDGALLLDMRTVPEDQTGLLANTVAEAIKKKGRRAQR